MTPRTKTTPKTTPETTKDLSDKYAMTAQEYTAVLASVSFKGAQWTETRQGVTLWPVERFDMPLIKWAWKAYGPGRESDGASSSYEQALKHALEALAELRARNRPQDKEASC